MGWICAVQTEFVAACELLDEEHSSPPIDSPHDDNNYILGRFIEYLTRWKSMQVGAGCCGLLRQVFTAVVEVEGLMEE